MNWNAYLRRLAGELALFLVACIFVFYVISGQEDFVRAVYMGLIATLCYGGVTYVLRQRTIGHQDRR
jgi:hypothetical protein